MLLWALRFALSAVAISWVFSEMFDTLVAMSAVTAFSWVAVAVKATASFSFGEVKVLLVKVCSCALKVNSSFPVSNGMVTVRSAVSSETAKSYVWSPVVSFIFVVFGSVTVPVKVGDAVGDFALI